MKKFNKENIELLECFLFPCPVCDRKEYKIGLDKVFGIKLHYIECNSCSYSISIFCLLCINPIFKLINKWNTAHVKKYARTIENICKEDLEN